MVLEKYKEKRDFSKTTEPSGEEATKEFYKKVAKEMKDIKMEHPLYVIQLHLASHLHHDLRLEMDGVLKSWAIPKDPLLTLEGKKILAVSVEDHPLGYSTFEGTIPEGQYGAGKVMIWDKGTYELIEKTDKGMVIKINGKKLNGIFVLFKFKPPNNWLFFKKKE
jgi:DNA ligase D-like protein (predicted 3'-phosphoesterase)